MKKLALIASAINSHPPSIALATALALVAFAGSASLAATPGSAPAPQSGSANTVATSNECLLVKNAAARDTCLAARTEYSKGNYRLSLALLRKALATYPKEGIIRVQIAWTMLRMDALGPAEHELRQARTDGAPDQNVLPMLLFVMVTRHEEVVLLNEFPEPVPNAKGEVAADILQGRAMALQSTARLPEAAAAMDRSLSLRRSTDGLLLRANIAAQQKDAALSNKFVDEAYRIAPQSASVMAAKLEQLEQSNDTAGVLALADRMQKFYPINSDPRESKIRVFLKQNQDAKAKAEVDAFLVLRAKSPVGLFYKAVLMGRAHDKKGAAEIVQSLPPQFLKAHPEYAVQMAQIMFDNGNVESGAGILGTALGVAPDLLEARLRLVAIRMSQNSPQSALLLLSPVKDSGDPRVQKLMAQARGRIAQDRAF